MSEYCSDCGTKMYGNICQNCQEELYIYDNQILNDGMDIHLSNDFTEKITEQKEIVRKKNSEG